jgi:UrcA family protein
VTIAVNFQDKVNTMKTFLNAVSVRKALMAITVVTAMTLPLLASASVPSISVTFDKRDLKTAQGVKHIYAHMRDAARDLCGSSNIRSLKLARANAECYEGTLTAAVERLDVPEITALHVNSFE